MIGTESPGLTTRLNRRLAGLMAYGPHYDGRVVVIGAAGVYLLGVFLARVVASIDIWPRLGVPSGPSTFFDARNVLAALECRRLGYDPLADNPCDPWGRPMVYPRVWLALRWIGIDQSHTALFAVLLILLFVGAALLLFGKITTGEGVLVAVAVCSPAIMLAIERANMDVAIFVLLVAAVLVWRPSGTGAVAAPVIVLAAATAKIYPVVALIAFVLSGGRRAARSATVCIALFAGYALVTVRDIVQLERVAPQGEYYSYGARILLARLYNAVAPQAWAGGDALKQALAAIPVAAIGVALWIWVRRRLPRLSDTNAGPRLLAFYMGALVYVGTFVLGNNFDYRLIFLLLTFPMLFGWIRSTAHPRRNLAAAALALILVLVWVSTLSPYVALADELVSWATAALLLALLAGSIPAPNNVLAHFRRRGPERAPVSSGGER